MTKKADFEIVIVGAGVVGLAIAEELSKTYDNILVVDKERSFGNHTSSRNSEIIHSGLYYPKSTLKTKLCIEGNRLLYEFAKDNKIPHRRCGKLIVASEDKEIPVLKKLLLQGLENGVSDLEMVSSDYIKDVEPQIKAIQALKVPSTGIIDSHQLMARLESNAENRGVCFSYNTEISNINKKYDLFWLTSGNDDVMISSRVLINSAGLWSDEVAAMAGIKDYKIFWCKGEYYKTTKYRNMNHLIYPVPDPDGKYLGIHTVLDLDGNVSFGPNATYVDNLDYYQTEDNIRHFKNSIDRYLDITENDLTPSMVGIRPKIQSPSETFKDFIIKNEADNGYNNLINLIGIESPGLTSCLAIAKLTKGLIQ